MKPGPRLDAEGRPEIFPGGTAARVMDLETQPDGHADLLLYGEFRFELEREITGPYRQAVVRPVEEPWLNERDAGIVAVRKGVVHLLRTLSEELGDKLPIDVDDLASDRLRLRGADQPRRLPSGPAADAQAPAPHRVPARARRCRVLSILRSRKAVIDMLRPFRRRAVNPERN